MKKIYCIISLCCATISTLACDICGSGTGSSYMGLLPTFSRKFFGLRYQQNGLIHHLGPNGSRTYLTTTETFRIVEAWGAVNIGNRFRIAAFVPYSVIERTNLQENISQDGFGDISVIGYCNLINSKKTTASGKLFSQSLWAGMGFKLPTGRYDPSEKSVIESSQNTFQLGSGSFDFSVHTMYDIRFHNTGLNLNASYKINTRNKDDYQYGNKLTLNALVYQRFNIGNKLSLAPNTGVLYENAAKDNIAKDIEVYETGGTSIMGIAGLELAAGRIGVGLNFQTPLAQDLAEGKARAKNRGMAYVSVAF